MRRTFHSLIRSLAALPTPREIRPRLPARRSSVLAAAALLALGWGKPAPDHSPLDADTQVLIDTMGIPHIYASSDSDAFFASGYTMARMRLFQIEMVRRQALGTA